MRVVDMLIGDIVTDGGTQSRVQLDWVAVSEYADAMREEASFPPVIVFYDGNKYWLADGFHRVKAAEKAGLDRIAADVRQGGRREALLHSVGANADHGVRRTNKDKRRSVEMVLEEVKDDPTPLSNREIARLCRVHNSTVDRARQSICRNAADRPAARTGERA